MLDGFSKRVLVSEARVSVLIVDQLASQEACRECSSFCVASVSGMIQVKDEIK